MDANETHSKPPYVKPYGVVGGKYNVWMVDGGYIRKHQDPDFSNCTHGYKSAYTPRDEIWIDWVTAPEKELSFFLYGLLIEIELLKSGVPMPQAIDIAAGEERRERAAAKQLPEPKRSDLTDTSDIEARIRKLGRARLDGREVVVWAVSGERVRDRRDPTFWSGAHFLIDYYVPEPEVWVEDGMPRLETMLTTYHELRECRRMMHGATYDVAHAEAAAAEMVYRHTPELLPAALRALGFRPVVK